MFQLYKILKVTTQKSTSSQHACSHRQSPDPILHEVVSNHFGPPCGYIWGRPAPDLVKQTPYRLSAPSMPEICSNPTISRLKGEHVKYSNVADENTDSGITRVQQTAITQSKIKAEPTRVYSVYTHLCQLPICSHRLLSTILFIVSGVLYEILMR